MEKQKLIESIKVLRTSTKKKNFVQTIDFIVNLKDIDLKKPDNHIDLFVALHNERGKKTKICGLVGAELKEAAKEAFDLAIVSDAVSYTHLTLPTN